LAWLDVVCEGISHAQNKLIPLSDLSCCMNKEKEKKEITNEFQPLPKLPTTTMRHATNVK